MHLDRELTTFRRMLPSLLQNPENREKFALVHEDTIDSIWPTTDAAMVAGYDRFTTEPFLVKRIIEHEEPVYFSRRVKPCR